MIAESQGCHFFQYYSLCFYYQSGFDIWFIIIITITMMISIHQSKLNKSRIIFHFFFASCVYIYIYIQILSYLFNGLFCLFYPLPQFLLLLLLFILLLYKYVEATHLPDIVPITRMRDQIQYYQQDFSFLLIVFLRLLFLLFWVRFFIDCGRILNSFTHSQCFVFYVLCRYHFTIFFFFALKFC